MIPKLLGVDLSLVTFAWSAGVNSSYPLANAKNYYPDSKTRSNGTGAGQTLTMTYGSAITPNLVVIHGQNWASLGATSVKLQYDDGAWQDAATFDIVDNNVQTKAVTGTGTNWRVLFSKGSALSAAPEIGNIFLGTSLNFEKPQEFNSYTNHPENQTARMRNLDGRLRTAQTYGAIRKHQATFRLQSDSFVTSYKAFLATVGNDGLPFYYQDKDSNLYLVNLSKGFNPYEAFRYNLNNIATLEMESTLADS